jgi:dolichol kinase
LTFHVKQALAVGLLAVSLGASASGMGATVGTNPAARAKSIERSTAFILAHER